MTATTIDSRALIRAAVGFGLLLPTEPELRLLHRWLDWWRGVGDVVTGMNREGYRFQALECGLRHVAATFSRDMMTAADGFWRRRDAIESCVDSGARRPRESGTAA